MSTRSKVHDTKYGVDGNLQENTIEWLNSMLPCLKFPPNASEELLRKCLIDGSILCSLLNRLSPGSVKMECNSESQVDSLRTFLSAMDDMGLPNFEIFDLEQGSIMRVLQCLQTLKDHFDIDREKIQSHSRRRWNTDPSQACLPSRAQICSVSELKGSSVDSKLESALHNFVPPEISNGLMMHNFGQKVNDELQRKQGCNADRPASEVSESELMKFDSSDVAPSHSLFNIVNKILDESIERKNGDVHRAGPLLKKVVKSIEERVSTHLGRLQIQNDLYKAREEKYQSSIQMLEVLATRNTQENEVAKNLLQQIKIEKAKVEEEKKHCKLDSGRLMKEKDISVAEVSALKQELELVKMSNGKHCLSLEEKAKDTKVELEKKVKELQFLLVESRKEVKELQALSEAIPQGWKEKELSYQNNIDFQFQVLQELRNIFGSIKEELLQTQRIFSEDLNYLGLKVRGLTDVGGSYRMILAENRNLYNEVQDLKGNIRVYCRIRPLTKGNNGKETTIECVGENGELVVVNPIKRGKDSRKLFKFNKVFGPTTTQGEVFMDTQPLIQSVLDGYNVCIFAYGQTGSGKTYTMTGPDISSKEDWGVNYRALSDLFNISQTRKSSVMYEVEVQMIEIYNEQVRDLLSSDGSQKRLDIWSAALPNGLAVPDASMHPVRSTKDVIELMNTGLMNRSIGATVLNDRSSRSHSVVTVHVRGLDLETDAVLRGNLHLVDLAGSERAGRTEATGHILKEAQHINKSLSALGDVIFALSQKRSHVPYRNSKLTQILQGSLGGQAKTLMFININPDVESYSETINNLKFGERVSGVELGAARSNKEGREVRGLMEQVESLKDIITKKDEQIERLQQLKASSEKHVTQSLRYASFPARRHSLGSPRKFHTSLKGKGSRISNKETSDVDSSSEHSDKKGEHIGRLQTNATNKKRQLRSLRCGSFSPRRHSFGSHQQIHMSFNAKGASDLDNSSDYSDKHSESGSQQSVDEFRHQKEFFQQQSKLSSVGDVSPNYIEDVELFGFGDADSDERLSDISDSGLSMGTETDGSLSSVVEFILFPETAKPAETLDRSSIPSRIPRPPQLQVKTSPFSSTKSSPMSSLPRGSKKLTAGSSSAKSLKRWQ